MDSHRKRKLFRMDVAKLSKATLDVIIQEHLACQQTQILRQDTLLFDVRSSTKCRIHGCAYTMTTFPCV
eukprot:12398831-Karenia_brevis.AAC.1